MVTALKIIRICITLFFGWIVSGKQHTPNSNLSSAKRNLQMSQTHKNNEQTTEYFEKIHLIINTCDHQYS